MQEEKNKQICTGAKGYGHMLGLSKRQIFRLNAAGKIPAPVKIGGSVRWRLSDIELWLEMGCPDRKTFEARQQSGGAA
jgi:predicted DNA-binding transcriptional regulator AlpA